MPVVLAALVLVVMPVSVSAGSQEASSMRRSVDADPSSAVLQVRVTGSAAISTPS